MLRGNVVVGIAGGVVLLAALAGLWEIQSRAGPFEGALAPVEVPFQVSGSYVATGPRGTTAGAPCLPGAGILCAPPRLEVDLRVHGLPTLGAGASYVAFLTGGEGGPLRLGALTARGDAHALAIMEDRDARAYRALVVTVEAREEAAAPGPLRVLARDVAGMGRDVPSDLGGAGAAVLGEGAGRVRAAEVGMAAKSLTAVGELRGAPRVPGWAYHAWLESLAEPEVFTRLGIWEWAAGGGAHATLDSRVEQVRLEDQARLVVTLEPEGAAAGRDAPAGFPAFAADFPAWAREEG